MADFKIAYKKTGGWEGGWNHVSNDRGGETYCGIARKFHPNWAGWKIVDENKPLRHGEKIKSDVLDYLVLTFYKSEFWDVVAGDRIEDQSNANTLYDFGVNAGYGRSIKNMQITLGITATGKITNSLINAINNPEKYLL